MFVIKDIHICNKERGKRRSFGVREISICYKERRLESVVIKEFQKVSVENEFHFCNKETRCLS